MIRDKLRFLSVYNRTKPFRIKSIFRKLKKFFFFPLISSNLQIADKGIWMKFLKKNLPEFWIHLKTTFFLPQAISFPVGQVEPN